MAASTSTTPMVSVVICTRDRAARLRSTLESLCHQTLGPDAFEVVIVGDGSTEDARDVARGLEPRLALRWSHQRDAGVASARNHGLFLARGVIVLFLDEGVVAEPELLERHLEAHRRFPEARFAVVGRVRLDPPIADDPLMRFVTEASGFSSSNPRAAPGELLHWSHFRAGRSSCKRGFLLWRGTFDSAFESAGEDVELAYRLSRHGFQVVHEPSAESRLVERETVDDLCVRMHREGEANLRFSRLHEVPEVQAWTGATRAADAWRALAPAYDAIVRSARELDRIARAREEARLALEGHDLALLHRAYAAAFEASRVKGIVGEVRGHIQATWPSRK